MDQRKYICIESENTTLIYMSSGLGAIEQFKRRDFDVVAYEARDSVGGLWYGDSDYISFLMYMEWTQEFRCDTSAVPYNLRCGWPCHRSDGS